MQLRVYLPLTLFTLLSLTTSTSATSEPTEDPETLFEHNLDALLRRSPSPDPIADAFRTLWDESYHLPRDLETESYDDEIDAPGLDLEAVKEAIRKAGKSEGKRDVEVEEIVEGLRKRGFLDGVAGLVNKIQILPEDDD